MQKECFIMWTRLVFFLITLFLFSSCSEKKNYEMTSEMNKRHQIELVYFDEESERTYGEFPVSRKYIAQLVDVIEQDEPAYVVLKFFYDAETEDDHFLSETLQKYHNIFTQTSAILKPLSPVSDEDIKKYSLSEITSKGKVSSTLIIPNNTLSDGFDGIGLVDFITKEGRYRNFPVFSNVRGNSIPSLALALVTDMTKEVPQLEDDFLVLGATKIEAPGGFMKIDLSEPESLYPIHSFAGILDSSDEHDFSNKIIIVFIENEGVRTISSDYAGLHNSAEIVADSINSFLKKL